MPRPIIPLEFVPRKEVRAVRLELSIGAKRELTKIAARESAWVGRPHAVSENNVTRAALKCFIANVGTKPLAGSPWFDESSAQVSLRSQSKIAVVTVPLHESIVSHLEKIAAAYAQHTGSRPSTTRVVRGIIMGFLAAQRRAAERKCSIEEEWFRQAA